VVTSIDDASTQDKNRDNLAVERHTRLSSISMPGSHTKNNPSGILNDILEDEQDEIDYGKQGDLVM